MWQNWFRFRTPGALVDLLSFELLASFPCRLLRHSALSHRCCQALRVHFSLHCVVRVVCPLVSLILLQCLVAVLSVPFSEASSSTACLFLWRVPISSDAFRDFSKRLRTCAQPQSVGFWHLEAACFVMGIMSARLNSTDVLDHGMFAEALLTVVCTMKAGACLQKRCSAVHVHHGKGKTVFSCFCCV